MLFLHNIIFVSNYWYVSIKQAHKPLRIFITNLQLCMLNKLELLRWSLHATLVIVNYRLRTLGGYLRSVWYIQRDILWWHGNAVRGYRVQTLYLSVRSNEGIRRSYGGKYRRAPVRMDRAWTVGDGWPRFVWGGRLLRFNITIVIEISFFRKEYFSPSITSFKYFVL